MHTVKYNDNGTLVDLKPVVLNLRFTRIVDKVGRISFEYPATDDLTPELTPRTEIQIFENDTFAYAGLIEEVEIAIHESVPTIQVQASGLMIEFTKDMTVPNVVYNNVPYTDVLNPAFARSLVKPSTWISDVEPTVEDFSYISSLQTSFSAFDVVRRDIGYHFRYAGLEAAPRRVAFGEFGQDSGITITKNPQTKTSVGENRLFVVDGGLTQIKASQNISNYIYVLGGGDDNGVNQVTLRDVDSGIIDPQYPILQDAVTANDDQTYDSFVYANPKTGPNTNVAYYLTDVNSVNKYGTLKEAVIFKDIYPTPSNGTNFTDTDRQRAANQLYRAARQYLLDHKDEQVTYRVTVFGDTTSLNVGDVVTLEYKGEINKQQRSGTTTRVWVDINVQLFVVEIDTEVDDQGVATHTLEVSNLLKKVESDIDIIADSITTVNDYERQRKGSVTTYPVYFEDSFDNLFPAKFAYYIPDEMVYTDYIKFKIRIREFRAYAKGSAAATPSHSHQMFNGLASIGGGVPTGFTRVQWNGGGFSRLPVDGANPQPLGNQTSASGAGTHSHTLTFGIFEDTTPPTNVKLYIDGVDYSGEVGTFSAFGDFPAPATDTFDILKAADNLGELDNILSPGFHTVELRCDSGRALGEIFVFNQFYLTSR